MSPREAAKDLIRYYVLRGETEQQLRHSLMGRYGPEYHASIGGWAEGTSYGPEKVVVTALAGEPCRHVFSLHQLYGEIQNEARRAAAGIEQSGLFDGQTP